MSIYTRGGDDGFTSLFPSGRAPKTDARMEALGALDELNSWLGVIRAQGIMAGIDAKKDAELERFQKNLIQISAEISCPKPECVAGMRLFSECEAEETAFLEREIDEMEGILPPIHELIYFQGPPASAFTQLARAVCRRAERRVWKVAECEETPVSHEILRWLNRFSDFLFTLGRYFSHRS